MCRNIKNLFNFAPHANEHEVQDAALQYVRKISGFNAPSQANKVVFDRAVNEIAHATHHLLSDLVTDAKPRNREVEAQKAKLRNEKRFGIKKS